jgi:hypothetical protein
MGITCRWSRTELAFLDQFVVQWIDHLEVLVRLHKDAEVHCPATLKGIRILTRSTAPTLTAGLPLTYLCVSNTTPCLNKLTVPGINWPYVRRFFAGKMYKMLCKIVCHLASWNEEKHCACLAPVNITISLCTTSASGDGMWYCNYQKTNFNIISM